MGIKEQCRMAKCVDFENLKYFFRVAVLAPEAMEPLGYR